MENFILGYCVLLHMRIIWNAYLIRKDAKNNISFNRSLLGWMKSQEEINVSLLNKINNLKRENKLLKDVLLNQ